MGRKNKRKSIESGEKSLGKGSLLSKSDPWNRIERGEAVTAHAKVGREPVVSNEPKEKNYDRLKNKRKRRSDGSSAEVIHQYEKKAAPQKRSPPEERNHDQRAKRMKTKETSSIPPLEQINVFESLFNKVSTPDDAGNLHSSPGLKSKKVHETRKVLSVEELEIDNQVKSGQKVKSRKKQGRLLEENSDYIVEEPSEDVVIHNGKSSAHHSKSGYRPKFANLFDGTEVDSDDSENDDMELLLDNAFGESDVEDESLEDEEIVELNGEGEEDEIDADEMRIDPKDIVSVVDPGNEDSDEEYCSDGICDDDECEGCCEDEEVEDEEGSVVSAQDAESDEEANLGEERDASIIEMGSLSPQKSIDLDKFPFNNDDSAVTASRAFAWIIKGCDVQRFFSDFYQMNCLVIKRMIPNFYGNLFSSARLVELLENNYIEYGTNINIAEYKNSIRKTMNGEGRVFPLHIQEHLELGRSVQLVNPQTFDDRIWYICEVLQELFSCFVGANTYLTPAGSSGFAPHWDEIDAFLLQVEGRKYWKVYAPRDDSEELPRESSGNFTEEDMKNRKPTFEGWIETGDLLYIPRGFIHQAFTDDNVHSLHVTISTGRQWAFADLMDKLIPEAISSLAEQRKKMRMSMPIGLFDMNGVADCDYRMEENFTEKISIPLDRHMSMLRNFIADSALESAVDLMAREFQKTALPPRLTSEEKRWSAVGHNVDIFNGTPVDFNASMQVRFIRRHGQRLIFETTEKCFIATRMNNSRLYEGRPEQTIDIPVEWSDAFAVLANHCPEWTLLTELPDSMSTKEKRLFCKLLFDNGLIMARPAPKKKQKSKK